MYVYVPRYVSMHAGIVSLLLLCLLYDFNPSFMNVNFYHCLLQSWHNVLFYIVSIKEYQHLPNFIYSNKQVSLMCYSVGIRI